METLTHIIPDIDIIPEEREIITHTERDDKYDDDLDDDLIPVFYFSYKFLP